MDWSPWPRFCQTLLTPEELERFRKVKKACHDAKSDKPVEFNGIADDVLALCETIKRLSHLRPDEFEFPEYAALVNPIAHMAYTLRFNGRSAAQNVVALQPGNGPIFEMTTESRVTDAELFVRPHIELVEPKTAEAMGALRLENISVEVDGERVVRNHAIDEFLIGLDGRSVRKTQFSFSGLVPGTLFTAVTLKDGEAVRNNVIGIFLPNASRVRIWISRSLGIVPMTLRVGMVLATYTTRSAP